MPIFALGVFVAVIAWVVYVIRTRDPAKRGRSLRKAALILMGPFSAFLALFIAGDTSRIREAGQPSATSRCGRCRSPFWPRSPGSALRLRRGSAPPHDRHVRALHLVGPRVRRLEVLRGLHRPGPGDRGLAIAAPLALLGWKRPFAAGVLLLLMMVPPAILLAIGGAISVAIFLAASPASVAGILYLLAARFERQGGKPPKAVQDGRSLPQAA